jgi:uridine phosphorylase
MSELKESELVLNSDGSIFHLHLLPEQIADTIILVGDPGRVQALADQMTSVEYDVQNREFRTVTGNYKNYPLSVVSTGIGTDNIDIVLNELDALVNIDLKTRRFLPQKKQLRFIRLGTSGSIQSNIDPGSWIVSSSSVGLDGLLYHYASHKDIRNLPLESALIKHLGDQGLKNHPYIVDADQEMLDWLTHPSIVQGITVSSNGFYGPQNRQLRVKIASANMNRLLQNFSYKGKHITNFEMESSAIYGLGKLMGHQCVTLCLVLANRQTGNFLTNYSKNMQELIAYTLEKINAGMK